MTPLSIDDFTEAVGETFRVSTGSDSIALQLLAATALPQGAREGGSFRLEFLGPVEPILPQAIYALERDGYAEEVFIVPVVSAADGTRYEAIFN